MSPSCVELKGSTKEIQKSRQQVSPRRCGDCEVDKAEIEELRAIRLGHRGPRAPGAPMTDLW